MSRVCLCLVALVLVTRTASAQDAGIVVGSAGGFTQIGPNNQPPRDTPPVVGRSTIRGRITTPEGQAVRRATVRVTAPELRGTRTTLTDGDGSYEFRELPAGRYSINVSKTTFVAWSYGQTQPGSPAKPLVLADGQTATAVDVRLPRGGVITGRIVDDFGEPVASANVSPMRQQFLQGQRRLLPAGNATTNDIGEYRIFGLAPGQYYVSATMPPAFGGGPFPLGGAIEGPEGRNGYAPTFYPGTTDATAAQKVTVGLSQTVGEINIVLLATRTATISGSVVDAQGQPFTSGFVSAMARGNVGGGMGMASMGGQLRADGTFNIPNIAPGEYVLRATRPVQRPATGTTFVVPEFSVAAVTVNGEDITGVRLAPVVQATIGGRITFDDAGAAQSVKPSTVRVIAQPLNGDDALTMGMPGGPPPVVQDDFTFELKAVPGRIALRANVMSATPAAPGGWQIKAIRVNGTDVTDSGVDVGSQGIRDVEIALTTQSQPVTGAVSDGRGGAVKDYVVLMFAQDRARWLAPFNRYLAVARPGSDDRFKATALPPGMYYAIALDHADASQWQDPEFLDALSRQASRFELTQGGAATLDLKLFTAQ